MTARIALIRRHPIKGIGGERLEHVALAPSRPLPGDRLWALLHEGGERHADERPGRWLPKSCFLQGAKAAALQAVEGGLTEGAPGEPQVVLTHPTEGELRFDPEREGARLVDWIRPLWPADFPAPTRLVRAPTAWADVSQPYLSLLSLATLAELEAARGQSFGTSRWRGNLWVDGWAPGAERDLIGHILRIGEVELRVVEPITRCPATSASSETGLRDIDMPEALHEVFGHRDFGVYVQVVTGGTIQIGDEVQS